MNFFKVTCIATALLCLVYTGDCDLLLDSLTRVVTEITPLINKIDNDIAVGKSLLNGINWDPTALASNALAAFSAVARPFLDAINLLKTMFPAAASCLTDAAKKIADEIAIAVMGYTNCVESAVSQIPIWMADVQDLVTRRNDSTIVNLWSDLQSLVQQGGDVAAVNSAIDSVKSLLTVIAMEAAAYLGQAIQTAVSVATCMLNVKLHETEQDLKIMAELVSCATGLGVPITLPALPAPPVNTTVIINQALSTWESQIATVISIVAALIADVLNKVNALKNQIAAIAPDDIKNALFSVVQPYINKLMLLKTLNALNPLAQADIQAAIDKLTELLNKGVTSATQVLSQLSQQAAMLEQQLASLANELKHLVLEDGVSAIMACANNVIYNTPEFIQACTDAVLNNSLHELDKIKGALAVVNDASTILSEQISSVLPGQVAVIASEAVDFFAATMAMLTEKHGITG